MLKINRFGFGLGSGSFVAVGFLFLAALSAESSAADNGFLEEIIVTAQKRQQNLQDIPVAASAFNDEILSKSSVKDIFDLQTIAPGLRIGQNQSATTSNFNIRGVGTSGSNFGLESSVGLYVDGVYRSRQSAIINNLVDIESIQVLRGPQGTLFGKNTPSGAILINTKKPTHEPEGFVELGAGNFGLFSASGAYSASLAKDVMAFRVSGFSGQRDGYVDDLNRGNDLINDRDRYGAQLQFLYTPNEDVSVRVIADYSEIDEVCCAAITLVDSLVANSRPGPIPGTDSLIRSLGATTTTTAQFDDYDMALSHLPVSQNEDRGLSAEVNWELENHTLTSISAWRKFETFEDIDVDFSDIDLFNRIDDAMQESFSQEFRIANAADSKVRYVVGLYYFTQDLDNDTTTSLGTAANPFFTSLPDFAPLQQLLDAIDAAAVATAPLAGLGLAVPATVDPFSPDGFAFNVMRQEHESAAIFGQLEYDFREDLTLTLGLRFTTEEKKLKGTFTQTTGGGPPDTDAAIFQLGVLQALGPFDPAFDPSVFIPFSQRDFGYYDPRLAIVGPRPDLDEKLDDDQVSGTVKLTWAYNEDMLLYLGFGTGYKSGGTNTDRIFFAFDPVFQAETSEAIEAGMKADFPKQNIRVNLALHKTVVDDFQSNAFQGAGFNLQNAGKLDTYGGELEVWWNPTENLDISAAYVRSVADFDEFDRSNCWIAFTFHTGIDDPGRADPDDEFCDRAGDRVSFNPEDFFVVTATRRFEFSDTIDGFARAEWTYVGDQMMDANNDPFKALDSYDLLSLSAGVNLEHWNTEITLWGRNVTDERYHHTNFDVPLQDGKLNAYPGEPRTYGLRLKVLF